MLKASSLDGLTFQPLVLAKSYLDTALKQGHFLSLADGAGIFFVEERDVQPPNRYVILLRDPNATDLRKSALEVLKVPWNNNREDPQICTDRSELYAAGFPENSLAVLVRGRAVRLVTTTALIKGRIARGEVYLTCSDCGRAVQQKLDRDCSKCSNCVVRDPAQFKIRPRDVSRRGRPWAVSRPPSRPESIFDGE